MFKVFGVVLVVLAIALAVVPTFTDCQSQGNAIELPNGKTVAMKCHWTGIAEIGVAVPLAIIGGMMAMNRRKVNLTNLSVLGIVLGALAIAFPSGLIGVCQTPTMICVTTMKPILLTLGSIATIVSIAGLVLSRKQRE